MIKLWPWRPVSTLVQAQRRTRRLAGPEPWPEAPPAPEAASDGVPKVRERKERARRPSPGREPNRLPRWFRPGGVLATSPGLGGYRWPPPARGVRPVEVRPAVVVGCAVGTVMSRSREKEGEKRERAGELDRGGRRLRADRRRPGHRREMPAAALAAGTGSPCFG